ncbi:hypothetical protein ACGFNP_21015 [Nonomuraea sp. NPDC049269]|uniref:hypothetical protein n=1 Tax=Nonomuraea sp. NPDC049269 TaxID=3364349 RepID=UPI00371D9232
MDAQLKACAALIDDLAEDCHGVEPLLHPLGFALGALDLPSYTSRRQAFPQTSSGEALRDVLAGRRN